MTHIEAGLFFLAGYTIGTLAAWMVHKHSLRDRVRAEVARHLGQRVEKAVLEVLK